MTEGNKWMLNVQVIWRLKMPEYQTRIVEEYDRINGMI